MLLYISNSNCQLLTNPSLTVEDFENALTNSTQLRKILKKHDFQYSSYGAHRLSAPATIVNPLIPDLRSLISQEWILKDRQDHILMKVDIYEWEPDHGPHPDVIKTISLRVSRNSDYTVGFEKFLETIMNRYPVKKTRNRIMDQYVPYRENVTVYANNSEIEVQTDTLRTTYGQFYEISFDLLR